MTESQIRPAALLEIKDVNVVYPTPGWRRPPFHALHDVSMDVGAGETVGLVGESGSGKTTLGRAVLGLADVSNGIVSFDGTDITHASRRSRRHPARTFRWSSRTPTPPSIPP